MVHGDQTVNAPILFCHYGNRVYLRYVLACARLSNPDKEVVLLGDATNRRMAQKLGVRHEAFADHAGGERLAEFEQVYRRIQGPKHKHFRGGRDWVEFVFKRWFFVDNFLRAGNIGPFWHFDSDNMLLVPLAPHEERFATLDCTDQCNGYCMNGYVSGPEVVERYLDKINEVFRRDDYLEAEQIRLAHEQPDGALTEMAAYRIFKEEEAPATARLNTIHEGASFDDCICQEHGMAMEPTPSGREIKRVHLNRDGRCFCRLEDTGALVEMNSLNLSWVPTAAYRIVLEHRKRVVPGAPPVTPAPDATDTLARRLAAGEGARPLRRLLRGLIRPLRRNDHP